MHKNIGEFLAAAGCHEAIAIASIGRATIVKPWHADAALTNSAVTPAEFALRYTFRNDAYHDGTDPGQAGIDQGLFIAGSLCGHDIPTQHQEEIQVACRRADNPFQLENNVLYWVTVQDLLDLEYVKDPNQQPPVWQTIYATLAAVKGSEPQGTGFSAPVPWSAPGNAPDHPYPAAPLSADESVRRSGAFFALTWPSLRKALQQAGGTVNVNMRHAVLDAFSPLITAAAQAGVIAEDGAIGAGE